ncbi:MAG: RNA polymerase sigma factor [Polyangiaceae bacterium]|nr:RNA polymerase sigma factor [Polyangiaceae bacterium]
MTSDSLTELELPELVRSAASRDPQAVQRLFVALLQRVRNLVRYLVRGDRDVDDLAQDALVAILAGLSGYRGDGAFYSWADRIVARSVFAALKRRRRAPGAGLGAVELSSLPAPAATEYLARRHVVALLDRLPSEQRTTLALRYVVGWTVAEIARDSDLSEETVRSRIRLGKNRLRKMLESEACASGGSSAARGQMVG